MGTGPRQPHAYHAGLYCSVMAIVGRTRKNELTGLVADGNAKHRQTHPSAQHRACCTLHTAQRPTSSQHQAVCREPNVDPPPSTLAKFSDVGGADQPGRFGPCGRVMTPVACSAHKNGRWGGRMYTHKTWGFMG